MDTATLIPVLLLMVLAVALLLGGAMLGMVISWRQKAVWREPFPVFSEPENVYPLSPLRAFWRRPACWLAIRSRNLAAVQAALELNNPKSCSWSEGLSGDRQLFISPPLNGWILVVGAGLPDPADDVDVCFRFLVELSKRLGSVQMFKADPVLHHHAWARVEAGRVVRAYAWAEKTLWNQGAKTKTEIDLGVKCFAYDENISPATLGLNELVSANVEKVPLLAAQWSLNPAALDARLLERSRGIAGRPARWY